MNSSNIVAVIGVAWLLWTGWWMWKFHFKPMRDRQRIVGAEDDVLLRKIAENIMMLNAVFGPDLQLRTFDSKEGRSIAVVCQKCTKVNRLVRGFRGAKCGSCKLSLVSKDMWTSAEMEVRLN